MRESDIRARLGRLPKGLTGVYNEIMNSIQSQPDCNLSLVTNALQWMLVSKRPPTPAELVAAAELNPPRSVSAHNPPVPLQKPTLAVELLIHSCEGLLLLDKQLDVVRFSHLSVQEYLETRNEIWGISVMDAQLFVSESCLWTLQYEHYLSSPLYEYATLNWFLHCKSYQDLVLSAENTKHELTIPLLNHFLGSFQQASTSYVKWVNWVRIRIDKKDCYFSSLSCVLSTPLCPAFAAAFAGLGELVSWLWHSEGDNMKIKNNNGDSLLSIASRHGTEWIMAEMLKRSPDISDVGNALIPASATGKLNTIKLLLDQGADVNLTSGSYRYTALGAAAMEGSLETVRLLLDRGADVNLIAGRGYSTALGIAALKGHLETVRLLLDRGADVNLAAGAGLLQSGDLKTVRLFLILDQGANFNYGAGLGAAAYSGHLEIVRLLLGRGADINHTGGLFGTALCAAAYSGHLEVVRLLLGRGAEFNLTHCLFGTALRAAAQNGNLETVRLLLDRGADVNLTDGICTALGAASSAYKGRLEIVRLLLDRGADVNLTSGIYGTALGAAAREGDLGTVKLLLDRGADVNLTGGRCTALCAAINAYKSRPKLKIVTLLLDRGADINLTSGRHGTALGAAAYIDSRRIVTLLLDRGADPNLTGGKYGSALGAAAYMGRREIIRLLLDRGANPDLTNSKGARPRDLAEQKRHQDIVDLLDSVCTKKTEQTN